MRASLMQSFVPHAKNFTLPIAHAQYAVQPKMKKNVHFVKDSSLKMELASIAVKQAQRTVEFAKNLLSKDNFVFRVDLLKLQ